jgi:membrane-bound inhibitor of C-type lysozyme
VVLTQIGQSGPDQVIAYQAISGSGARYLGRNVEFWEHQGEATVTWFDQQLTCKKID